MATPKLTKAILLKDVDATTVRWVQNQLVIAVYLAKDGVDGIVGDKTLAALASFKDDFYLEYPAAIGPSTIEVLESVEGKHEVEDQPDTVPTTVNADAGKKSGKTATLSKVGLVYENEFVFPGTYITWGEMTRGFTRLPMGTAEYGSPEQVVNNMIELAKVFGTVRTKFGSPIAINSAYRPPNLAIGASKSQHKSARALDVRPLNGDYKTLLEVIKAVPEVKGVGLAGPKKGFWHMDIRPGRRAFFSY
ncbi:MAG TPA: D-Ala-D-Ala carboxypeptidase family metallohydrolase [Trichocoleus sp.]